MMCGRVEQTMEGRTLTDDQSADRPKPSSKWKRLSSRPLARGPVHLDEDLVELPNGHQAVYHVLRARGFSCICPVTSDGRVALVRQYRYALQRVTVELPSGAIEEGETPAEAAERELLEEAGLVSDQWAHLGTFWTMPGRGDERAHLYLASNVAPSTRASVRDDEIEVVLVPIDEALRGAESVRDALCLRLAGDFGRPSSNG